MYIIDIYRHMFQVTSAFIILLFQPTNTSPIYSSVLGEIKGSLARLPG